MLIARHPDTNTYCSYSVSPTSISAPSTLTTATLTITTQTGCAWTSVSNDAFITITSGSSGTGSGSSGVSIAVNAGTARSGSITIAGLTVGVSQAAMGGSTCVGATSASVVPCGYGYGMSTRAAYGLAPTTQPTLYRVQVLTDSGSHSLREALEASGPRVVVFETSGYIDLTSDIVISNPYVTIAGQTAPSPGISVRYYGIQVYTHDVFMQHMRIRPGDLARPPILATADHDSTICYMGCYNVVYDHNSFSWAGDKNSLFGDMVNGGGATYWRNINAEALYWAANVIFDGAGAGNQPSSLGLLVQNFNGTSVRQYVSIIQNLFAHNSDRNPEIQGPDTVQILNNVVYDWGQDNVPYQQAVLFYSGTAGASFADIVGNKYIGGSGTHPYLPLYAVGTYNIYSGSQIYLSDNALASCTASSVQLFNNFSGSDPRQGSPVVGNPSGFTPLASSAVQSFVLTNAGARPLDRDAVDAQVVADVTGCGGTVISSQSAVGGWPTLAVNTQTFTSPASPNTVTASGYTNLELKLQADAAAIE